MVSSAFDQQVSGRLVPLDDADELSELRQHCRCESVADFRAVESDRVAPPNTVKDDVQWHGRAPTLAGQPANWSFDRRTRAKASAGEDASRPIGSTGARRNGLVTSSAPIVVGTVGCPRLRDSSISSARSRTAGAGSTLNANFAFASAYSCAE